MPQSNKSLLGVRYNRMNFVTHPDSPVLRTENLTFNHTLMVGGGIKVPKGRFRHDENNVTDVANANFQSGTGTTDVILNAFTRSIKITGDLP